jgi:hypothetical protein
MWGGFGKAEFQLQPAFPQAFTDGLWLVERLFGLCKCQNRRGWELQELPKRIPLRLRGQAAVEFKAPDPMQPDSSFFGKLFMRQSGLFSPDHEQIADGLDFERKRLVMEEKPCFLDVCDMNCTLCKCQMR